MLTWSRGRVRANVIYEAVKAPKAGKGFLEERLERRRASCVNGRVERRVGHRGVDFLRKSCTRITGAAAEGDTPTLEDETTHNALADCGGAGCNWRVSEP
jgi:hypothetical protein